MLYISNFIPVIVDKSFFYLIFQQVIHICKYKMVHTEKSFPSCSSLYPSPLPMESTVIDSYVSFQFLYSQRNIDTDSYFYQCTQKVVRYTHGSAHDFSLKIYLGGHFMSVYK